MYAGMGCAIFWGAFLLAENKFLGIIFGKITSSYTFWGVILEIYLFDFDQISPTLLKFWMAVTILG